MENCTSKIKKEKLVSDELKQKEADSSYDLKLSQEAVSVHIGSSARLERLKVSERLS